MLNKLMARRIARFKTEYNFVPDRDNPTQGTICVEGKTYKVDMDLENPDMYVGYLNREGTANIGRQLASEVYSPDRKIHLAKLMFRVPYRIGIGFMLHEVGHVELHNVFPQIANNASKQIVDQCIDYVISNQDLTDMYLELLIEKCDQIHKKDEYLKKLRWDSYQRAEAHVDDSHKSHANASEFEADAFAANRVGRVYIALAVIISNIQWIIGEIKQSITNKDCRFLRSSLWDMKIDICQRISALCDRKLQHSHIYKIGGA